MKLERNGNQISNPLVSTTVFYANVSLCREKKTQSSVWWPKYNAVILKTIALSQIAKILYCYLNDAVNLVLEVMID